MKLRKNLTISPDIWATLETLRRIQGKSISDIIETSVRSYVKTEKISSLYLKIMTDPDIKVMSQKESDEITAILDKMTEEDLRPGGEIEI